MGTVLGTREVEGVEAMLDARVQVVVDLRGKIRNQGKYLIVEDV